MSAHADELKFRAKFLRVALLANCGLFLLLLGGGAMLLTTVARATGAHAPAGDEKDIRAVLDAQQTAWNKGDLDGFMTGYWNDEKLTFISGGGITSGWKATKERYEKRYKADGKEMGKLAFTELHVELLSPNAATLHGRFELTFEKEKDEKKQKVRGRFTLILRKFPDGWKITHDHTSAEEAKPAPVAEPPAKQFRNPWAKRGGVAVAPLPRIVPPRNETEEQQRQRACHECKRIEEAIDAYVSHPNNPGKSYDEKLPTSVVDLLKPPFDAASPLPRGEDELVDPWGKMYQFRPVARKDGTYFILIQTYSAKDGTGISQLGIGDASLPKP